MLAHPAPSSISLCIPSEQSDEVDSESELQETPTTLWEPSLPNVYLKQEAVKKPAKRITPTRLGGGEEVAEMTIYGMLFILGTSSGISKMQQRPPSSFILRKRQIPNGVKKSKIYSVPDVESTPVFRSKQHHTVSFKISRTTSLMEEYVADSTTDMFQVGRSTDGYIDFVVTDTFPDRRQKHPEQRNAISRYACRIVVDREGGHAAKIYAAGFDASKNIFLGENAVKWHKHNEVDGLITNGLLIMKPKDSFTGKPESGVWREISVGGAVFPFTLSRRSLSKEKMLADETNELQDGTVMDLCGVTLIYRTAQGLRQSPTREELDEMVKALNAGKPLCPVYLTSLELPFNTLSPLVRDKQPYVYVKCGHVQGQHEWGLKKNTESRKCPLCRTVGSVIKLRMGTEPAFYVDKEQPSYAFNPCGHMASPNTVKYWASVGNPRCLNEFRPCCPFCGTPLQQGAEYVKLIFQDNIR